MSGATAGALVLALTTGAAGCDRPTGAEPRAIEAGFDAMLEVSYAQSTYWLQPGDTINVRIHVTPEPGTSQAGRTEGTIAYSGVPVWSRSRESAAAFEAGYFTHPDLGERLISVFWGDNPAGARLVLFLNPDPLALDWMVTGSDAEGRLIEIARGRGIITAS